MRTAALAAGSLPDVGHEPAGPGRRPRQEVSVPPEDPSASEPKPTMRARCCIRAPTTCGLSRPAPTTVRSPARIGTSLASFTLGSARSTSAAACRRFRRRSARRISWAEIGAQYFVLQVDPASFTRRAFRPRQGGDRRPGGRDRSGDAGRSVHRAADIVRVRRAFSRPRASRRSSRITRPSSFRRRSGALRCPTPRRLCPTSTRSTRSCSRVRTRPRSRSPSARLARTS